MAMPAQPTEWTVEMVRALPDDGNRYEVIGGELFVTPAPSWTHQRAVRELLRVLMPYLEQHAVGDPIIAPADVLFGPKDMVEPDLFVVPLIEGKAPRTWEQVGRLLLAVEVLSPSTLRADRGDKRELYQRKACRSTGWSTSMRGGSSGGARPIRQPRRSSTCSRGSRIDLPSRS